MTEIGQPEPSGEGLRAFVLAMGWVGLAVLELEQHKLQGLVAWYWAQWSVLAPALSLRNRVALVPFEGAALGNP
jgi:hypothetical protein